MDFKVLIDSGGKHLYMIKENIRLTMPNPHKKDISVDLILKILKHARITLSHLLPLEGGG